MPIDLRMWEDVTPDETEVSWLIPDLLESGSMMAIVGPPATGKSFLSSDMAAAVATGTPWLGLDHFTPSKKCRVVYMSPEGLTSSTSRLNEQFLFREVSPDSDSFALSGGTLTSSGANDLGELAEFAPDVVFVDTWARATPGIDENSASQVGKMINSLDILRLDVGCAVVIVHHTNIEGSRMRGTSALFGAVDTQLIVSRNAISPLVFDAKVDKQKNAPAWASSLHFSISGSKVSPSVGHPVAVADPASSLR